MNEPAILVSTWTDGLFTISGKEREQELVGQPVRGLTTDRRGGAIAIVAGHELRRRTPNGEWTTIISSESDLSCCMAVGDLIYVGTDDARIIRISDNGEFEWLNGFDRVAGRDTWFAGSAIIDGKRVGPPLGIRSVAAVSDGSVLFANVHVGGIPRSMNGGTTWEPTIDIHTDVHEVSVCQADPRIAAAASAVGLCISRDSGATWTIESEGLHATHCSAVAFSGDDIIFSAAASPFVDEGRIYRRPIRPDGSIAAVEGGMPPWTQGAADTGCIAANGSSLAIADRGGNLYLSDDFGRNWSCTNRGLPAPSGVLIC